MNQIEILRPENQFDSNTGLLSGKHVGEKIATIGDLKGIFANEEARAKMEQETVAYRVQYYFPVDEGTEGGLFFGNTSIYPGKVGDEFFMTKGHFHAKGNRGEYYWCIKGEGMLVFMDRDRQTWAEQMSPGSLHYMPAHVAHRTVNTGSEPMTFGACWPSDAGHDYASILKKGFGARVVENNGKVSLVRE